MTERTTGLSSDHGRWIFPVAGGEVTQVRIDYAFGLVIETYDERNATAHVRISTPFEYLTAGVVKTIDPEQTEHLSPLLTLHKAVVEEGYAVKDGHLLLRFSDDRCIRVEPHEQYEAWIVSGHLPPIEWKFTVVAVPNGGVAVL